MSLPMSNKLPYMDVGAVERFSVSTFSSGLSCPGRIESIIALPHNPHPSNNTQSPDVTIMESSSSENSALEVQLGDASAETCWASDTSTETCCSIL